jgi:hypothetical protein
MLQRLRAWWRRSRYEFRRRWYLWFFTLILFLAKDRIAGGMNSYIDAHSNWLAIAFRGVTAVMAHTPEGIVLYVFSIVVLGLVVHAYIETRPASGKLFYETAASDLVPAEIPHMGGVVTKEVEHSSVEPNLVCKGVDYKPGHLSYGTIAEGHDRGNSRHLYAFPGGEPSSTDMGVVIAIICNEFRLSPKVGSVDDITAQVIYSPPGGNPIEVNRAPWLSGHNRTDFVVNDTERLIIAAAFAGDDPAPFILPREYGEHNDFYRLTALLEADIYHVEVRLISESRGIEYQRLPFRLAITREPEFNMTLVQIKALTSKEVCEQLERFLLEGNNVLASFPREREHTEKETEGINDWERRVVAFMTEHPDRLSVPVFLSDVPPGMLPGGAISPNWKPLIRLATRLTRLNQFIDEFRRA